MKFGQYELLARIAVGGMAEVYEGRAVGAEGFEKHVAIKRILPDLAEDERFVKMLLTEARIHSALSHRNIVQIHDLGISEDGEYFIVLEYVEGYDLRVIQEQLTEQKEIIPEALSLHIAAEVAQGLHFAHELRGPDGVPLGIVHRDVSPSNVLISMAGEVKLSDFGLAKRRHDRSFIGSLKGNLAYMSPEQARQAELDRRTDIFSLGAVLFELLTGRRLRDITDEVRGWQQVASGMIPPARSVRPDLPESFERLLARALAVDPAQRFPDAASFGAAIREVTASMDIPVGASDLQTLLGMLAPARRPRSLLELSKVIRLGPEADALHEAIAAPTTPPPEVALPPAAPPAPTPPPAASAAAATAAAPATPPLDRGPDATPLPLAPLPPVRARQATPSSAATPQPPARTRQSTPPSPAPLRTERVTPAATVPLPRTRTPSTPAAAPSAPPPGPVSRTPFPPVPSPVSRTPFPPVPSPVLPGAPAASPRKVPSRPELAAIPALPEAPAFPSAPAPPSTYPSTYPAWQGANALALAPAMGPTPISEPRLPQVKPTGMWRLVVVAVAAGLILVAGAVHLTVIPLEVLFTWNTPVPLYVASDPEGAAVKVDGVPLADPAPTKTEVRRDRREHVLELAYPGHRPTREIVRYDRSVVLSFVLRLQKNDGAAAAETPAGLK
jgi:serine/threonine-protein kinase